MDSLTKKDEKVPLPKAIVLDADDVICDFLGFLVLIHNKKHKTHVTRNEIMGYPLKGEEVEDIYGDIVKHSNIEKTFKDLEPHGLYTILPVFPESKQAMVLMRELGFKIIVMTARSEKYREQTLLNFLANDVPFDELFFVKDKAANINKLKDKYDIAMFVDDRATTVKAVNNNCDVRHCILINKPHNSEYKLSQKINRANDLLETIKYLKEEVKETQEAKKEETK